LSDHLRNQRGNDYEYQNYILLASIFAATTATAQPLTPNEIFSAIDGEYNHLEDDVQRVNFSMPALDSVTTGSTDLLNQVLSGIDGEYEHQSGSAFRVNYLMSSQSDSSGTLNEVLSGIDGEYEY